VERKLKTSIFPLVLVNVGAVPPAHFTLAGHVTVRAVPSAVNARLNPMAIPEVAGVFEMASVVMFALSEQVNKLQVFKFTVNVLLLMLITATVSVYLFAMCKLSGVIVPLVLTSLDP
jgi:hypothetical protein